MSKFEDNIKWLREQLAKGRYIHKAYRPSDFQPRFDHGGDFVADNVSNQMRLYLFETETERMFHVDKFSTFEGWPAEYEQDQGVMSPASGKIDYAKITKEIVGR